jgi:hypothetical protein
VRVDDLAHDGEPEPRPLRLGREERLEDLHRHVRHAGAVVGRPRRARLAAVAAVVEPDAVPPSRS